MLKQLTLRRAALGLLGLAVFGFILLQLLPVGAFASSLKREANPPVTESIVWSSEEVEAIARRACYDCHSNETIWPWYANIAPASWLLTRHVNLGRDGLNFSEFDLEMIRSHLSLDDLEWQVYENMPPPTYLVMHPEADLTQAERDALYTELAAILAGGEEHEEGMEH